MPKSAWLSFQEALSAVGATTLLNGHAAGRIMVRGRVFHPFDAPWEIVAPGQLDEIVLYPTLEGRPVEGVVYALPWRSNRPNWAYLEVRGEDVEALMRFKKKPGSTQREISAIAAWLTTRAAGQRLKNTPDLKKNAKKQINATWRQVDEAFQFLPQELRYKRGRPLQSE